MLLYECSNCKSEVKAGSKYCSECGIKLEWPEEKPVKQKADKKRVLKKTRTTVKLPVSPDNLFEVIPRKGQWFAKPYIWGILFGAYGYIATIGSINKGAKKISVWIDNMRTEDADISFLIKRMRKIRGWGVHSLAITILATIVSPYIISTNCIAFYPNFGFFLCALSAITYLATNVIGIVCSAHLIKACDNILNDINIGKEYNYSFDDFAAPMQWASSTSDDEIVKESSEDKNEEEVEEEIDF